MPGRNRPQAQSPQLPPEYAGAQQIALPFGGPVSIQMSPASRVPSHGTNAFATRYAIDLVPVGPGLKSTAKSALAALFRTESPRRFFGFGQPVLSPGRGVVVSVHASEPDNEARRSPFTLIPYALSQRQRVAAGAEALAGNNVIIQLESGSYVSISHLQQHSICVDVGEAVVPGTLIAQVGNSGNSTEPHIHLQMMDGPNAHRARAVPFTFTEYVEVGNDLQPTRVVTNQLPVNGSVIQIRNR